MRPFDTAMVCGRFQHVHKGHEKLFDMALTLCDRVLILVGSSQEVATERNPYDVATRIEMIRAIYGNDNDRVMVRPLNDMTNENDACVAWGSYLMTNTKRILMKQPELMIYGNDEARSKWFDTNTLKNTSEFIINRNELNISATMLRSLLVLDKREEWMQFTHPRIHKHYDRLRAELLQVPFYKNKYDTILRDGIKLVPWSDHQVDRVII